MPPDLEERLRALEMKSAADTERDRHIDRAVESLQMTADRLEAAFNQSKGAMWVMGGIAGISGALSSIAAHLFWSKP